MDAVRDPDPSEMVRAAREAESKGRALDAIAESGPPRGRAAGGLWRHDVANAVSVAGYHDHRDGRRVKNGFLA